MKNITLKEMLDKLVECIINQKEEYPVFYYRRINECSGNNEYIEITQVDLLNGRFKTIDDDFSEFNWEIEKSHIYMKEGEINGL